jgi:hypothetical protein
MTPIEKQFEELRGVRNGASSQSLPSGAYLVRVPDYELPPGWNAKTVTILFVAPAGYPAAKPDCFWTEQAGLRLENGTTPANTNDSNPIPEVGQKGTWFSWHIQNWNPNKDTLVTYLNVIRQRLKPAR